MPIKQQWHIRKAQLKDAKQLHACMEAAYAVYQQRMNGKRLPPIDVDYSAEIKNFPVWVADNKGKIVGGVILIFNDTNTVITNIAVHPDFQGLGIGKGLMTFAESKAREKRHVELKLFTHAILEENISLYRHWGWKEIDRNNIKVGMNKII